MKDKKVLAVIVGEARAKPMLDKPVSDGATVGGEWPGRTEAQAEMIGAAVMVENHVEFRMRFEGDMFIVETSEPGMYSFTPHSDRARDGIAQVLRAHRDELQALYLKLS